jgi:hypothetical protein
MTYSGEHKIDYAPGATRRLALAAMRSLFTTLKAQRVLFTNRAAPLTACKLQPARAGARRHPDGNRLGIRTAAS